jgi:hypothetical protein
MNSIGKYLKWFRALLILKASHKWICTEFKEVLGKEGTIKMLGGIKMLYLSSKTSKLKEGRRLCGNNVKPTIKIVKREEKAEREEALKNPLPLGPSSSTKGKPSLV